MNKRDKDMLVKQIRQPIDDYEQLLDAIKSASTYKPSADDKRLLDLFTGELKKAERYLQSSEVLNKSDAYKITYQSSVRLTELIFDAESSTAGWLIWCLRKRVSKKRLVNGPRTLPELTRWRLVTSINDRLEAMRLRAVKIQNNSAENLKIVGEQIKFLEQHSILKPFFLTDIPLRPLKSAMGDLALLRETFLKLTITEINNRSGLPTRPKQSTNLPLKTIGLIDRIEDYLHSSGLYKYNPAYAVASSQFRHSLIKNDRTESYAQHKSSEGYIQLWIDGLRKLKSKFEGGTFDPFFYELDLLESRIKKHDEQCAIKGRSGQEPNNIRRRFIVLLLRLWWRDYTGDTSRVTKTIDGYSGPFYEFVSAELRTLKLMVDGHTLSKTIKSACDDVDGTYC